MLFCIHFQGKTVVSAFPEKREEMKLPLISFCPGFHSADFYIKMEENQERSEQEVINSYWSATINQSHYISTQFQMLNGNLSQEGIEIIGA